MIGIDIQHTRKLIAYTPIIVLFGVSILLVWINFDRLVYFTTPKIPEMLIATKENQKLAPAGMEVTFRTKNIELNKAPVIYKNTSNNKLTEAKTGNIASVFGFSGQSEQAKGETSVWRENKEVLTINKKNKLLNYSNNFSGAELAGYPSLDLGQTKLALKDLYQKLGFSSGFVNFDSPQSALYKKLINIDGAEENISPSEANYVTLIYPFLINKQPLVASYPSILRVKATYGKGGKLVYLQTPIIFGDWQQDIKYSGLSEDGIKSELSKGKATLVKYDPVIHKSYPKVDPVNSIEITSIKSAYLYPTADYLYLVPIYIIEADGVTEPGTLIKTTFYLPAFSSALFK